MSTVTRIRRNGLDADAAPIPGENRLVLTNVSLSPRFSIAARETASGAIQERGRDGAITGRTLYGPYGIDIVPTDFIEVDETDVGLGIEVWKVEGQPARWFNPLLGSFDGSETSIRRTTG